MAEPRLTLYGSRRSPFVRKVVVAAVETGIDDRIERIDCEPSDMDPAFLAVSPIGKIPTLVLPDGSSFPESDLIVAYLDSLGSRVRLIPDGPERWPVLRRQALADGFMEAAVICRDEMLRGDDERSHTVCDKLLARMRRCLDALETEIPMLGDAITVAPIAIGCACGYADFRFPALDWRETHPALAAWYARFAERPSMQATRPSL